MMESCILATREQVLQRPELDVVEDIRFLLSNYFGRVAVTMKKAPSRTLIANMVWSLYDSFRKRTVMTLHVPGYPRLQKLYFYEEDILNYVLYGILPADDHNGSEILSDDGDYIASVALLDL